MRKFNYRHQNSYKDKSSWSRLNENPHTMQSDNSIYSDVRDNSWQHQNNPYDTASNYQEYQRSVYNRGLRERRDIFDQLESVMSL